MTNPYVKDIVAKIPFEPGIYMMKDEKGEIIYVGKAISLRKRVRQYFQKNNKTKRIENMASLVRDIDYIVVNNEVEALNLECNYIKKLSPKFNVLLKDDKTYPYIKVTIKDKYPLIYVTRRRLDDKALYFGPYTNVGAMRDALHTIKEIFPVKRCKYNLDKTTVKNACLYYHIGRCLGPCINDVSLKAYKDMIDEISGASEPKVFPVWNGGGTVKLSILDAEYNAITPEFQAEIKELIDPEEYTGQGVGMAPIGHQVTIDTPTDVTINIEADVDLDTVTAGQVQEPAETYIEQYLLSVRKDWVDNEYTSVYIAQIVASILKVNGIKNVSNVKINGVASDINLENTALEQFIPVLGTVTLNVL